MLRRQPQFEDVINLKGKISKRNKRKSSAKRRDRRLTIESGWAGLGWAGRPAATDKPNDEWLFSHYYTLQVHDDGSGGRGPWRRSNKAPLPPLLIHEKTHSFKAILIGRIFTKRHVSYDEKKR